MWHINKRADRKMKALVLTCDAALWRRRWAARLFTAVATRAAVLGWWSNIHYHTYGPARQRGAGRSWWRRQVAAAGAAAHAGLWAGGRPGGNIGNYTSCRQKERGQEGHFKIRERLFTYIWSTLILTQKWTSANTQGKHCYLWTCESPFPCKPDTKNYGALQPYQQIQIFVFLTYKTTSVPTLTVKQKR